MSRRVLDAAFASFRTFSRHAYAIQSDVLYPSPGISSSYARSPLAWAALASVTAGVAYGAHSACDGSTPMQKVRLSSFRHWLESHGANLDGIDFTDETVRAHAWRVSGALLGMSECDRGQESEGPQELSCSVRGPFASTGGVG